MDFEIGWTYIYLFLYYIIVMNIVLLFYSRPAFLKRFSFNYGNIPIRAAFATLLLGSSFLLGVMTYVIKVFNGLIIL